MQVTQGGMTGVALSRSLLAPQRTLGVGQSIVMSAVETGCNELMPSGADSRYIMAVYNTSTTPTSNAAVQVSGDGAPAAGVAQGVAPALSLSGPRLSSAQLRAEDRHGKLLEDNRREYEQLRGRFAGDPRMRASRDVVSRDPVPPPATRTFHVANINTGSFCSNYYVAAGTRVYYSGKIAIYEDDATPAGLKAAANPTMQDYYNRIGDQFNADMEPVIRNNFGDVLRRDAQTDNNGVLVAFFTPLINNNFAGVAGFVVSCDLFPDADAAEPAVGGPYAGTSGQNGSSNFGEVFYAYQPTSTGTGFGTVGTPDYWYRTIRSTFIHETKHVASNVARTANGSPSLEVSWLEEGTARHSEELWMRNAVDNVAWKANTGYGSAANPINVYCDLRATGACAAGTPAGEHHAAALLLAVHADVRHQRGAALAVRHLAVRQRGVLLRHLLVAGPLRHGPLRRFGRRVPHGAHAVHHHGRHQPGGAGGRVAGPAHGRMGAVAGRGRLPGARLAGAGHPDAHLELPRHLRGDQRRRPVAPGVPPGAHGAELRRVQHRVGAGAVRRRRAVVRVLRHAHAAAAGAAAGQRGRRAAGHRARGHHARAVRRAAADGLRARPGGVRARGPRPGGGIGSVGAAPSGAAPTAVADTVRGTLLATGSEPAVTFVVVDAAGRGTALEGDRGLLRRLVGLDVVARGARRRDALQAEEVTVRGANGVAAVDGVLVREGAGYALVVRGGGRRSIARLPAALQGAVGARVWLAGDLDGDVDSSGVISPSP